MGELSFNLNILPTFSSSYTLGTSSQAWQQGYVNNINENDGNKRIVNKKYIDEYVPNYTNYGQKIHTIPVYDWGSYTSGTTHYYQFYNDEYTQTINDYDIVFLIFNKANNSYYLPSNADYPYVFDIKINNIHYYLTELILGVGSGGGAAKTLSPSTSIESLLDDEMAFLIVEKRGTNFFIYQYGSQLAGRSNATASIYYQTSMVSSFLAANINVSKSNAYTSVSASYNQSNLTFSSNFSTTGTTTYRESFERGYPIIKLNNKEYYQIVNYAPCTLDSNYSEITFEHMMEQNNLSTNPLGPSYFRSIAASSNGNISFLNSFPYNYAVDPSQMYAAGYCFLRINQNTAYKLLLGNDTMYCKYITTSTVAQPATIIHVSLVSTSGGQ